jgi:hypothetical protein
VVKGTGADLAARLSSALVAGGYGLSELRTIAGTTLEDAYLRKVRDT